MNSKLNISIIIPCFNGEKYIKGCLESILESEYQDYEVIIVDDCSSDSSRQILKGYTKYKQVKIYELDENKGPAVARNFGVTKSKGQVLFFLDIDTKIENNCLAEIEKVFKVNNKLGAIQTELVLGDSGKLETAGHFLSRFGFPYEIGVGDNAEKHTEVAEIFGARSAGMAVRRNVFETIGGFDEDYLIYGEETDLSWRIWLAGYSIAYVPTIIVRHYSKSSMSEKTKNRIFYQGAKNNTSNILKNGSLTTIFWLLPLHFLGWIAICIKLLIQGRFTSAWSVIKGLGWNVLNLTWVLNKRSQVNKYIDNDNKAGMIIWGPATLATIINKGINWYKNV